VVGYPPRRAPARGGLLGLGARTRSSFGVPLTLDRLEDEALGPSMPCQWLWRRYMFVRKPSLAQLGQHLYREHRVHQDPSSSRTGSWWYTGSMRWTVSPRSSTVARTSSRNSVLVERHREHVAAPGPQHAVDLRVGAVGIGHVLEHVGGQDQIDALAPEGERHQVLVHDPVTTVPLFKPGSRYSLQR